MKRIAIIGGGWVGAPLAEALAAVGHQVIVSRRSAETLAELSLSSQQISSRQGFVFDLAQPDALSSLIEQLTRHRIEYVIGAFPPGFRQGLGEAYVDYWNILIQAAQQTGVDKLVMLSSTSVYPNQPATMREEDASLAQAVNNPQYSEKARIILQAEQKVIDSGLHYAIVRFSGLYGPGRHPARFVRMLKQVSQQAPANMLHRDDAVGVACFATEQLTNCVVNATSPQTVCKAEFYQQAIACYPENLLLPVVTQQPDKRISADKLCSLGYHFCWPNVSEGLKHCQ